MLSPHKMLDNKMRLTASHDAGYLCGRLNNSKSGINYKKLTL